MAIEELIAMAELSASCEVHGLLKRQDEKYVTERAYNNLKFVEDFVRDVALALNHEPRVGAYVVKGALRVDPQPLRLRAHRADKDSSRVYAVR